jgi:hypothetical protein
VIADQNYGRATEVYGLEQMPGENYVDHRDLVDD